MWEKWVLLMLLVCVSLCSPFRGPLVDTIRNKRPQSLGTSFFLCLRHFTHNCLHDWLTLISGLALVHDFLGERYPTVLHELKHHSSRHRLLSPFWFPPEPQLSVTLLHHLRKNSQRVSPEGRVFDLFHAVYPALTAMMCLAQCGHFWWIIVE